MFIEAAVDSRPTFFGKNWGASWGDFHQDGWVDLHTSNHRDPATLYQNNQDGTFSLRGCLKRSQEMLLNR